MDRSPPQSPPQPPPEAASPDPATPPRVPGDDKDWTWVLERRCPECRFDAATVDPGDVAGLLRANARSWLSVLAGDEDRVRRRPSPDVWSALEYAAHVRDVHRLYLERLELMLEHDGPHYPNWDQDVTAVELFHRRYRLEIEGRVAEDSLERLRSQWIEEQLAKLGGLVRPLLHPRSHSSPPRRRGGVSADDGLTPTRRPARPSSGVGGPAGRENPAHRHRGDASPAPGGRPRAREGCRRARRAWWRRGPECCRNTRR